MEFARAGALTGGANANRDYLADKVRIDNRLKKEETDILFDAQTSGGLLIAIDNNIVEKFTADAEKSGIELNMIGRVFEKTNRSINVI
ncbi:MAG: hypothetical protein DRP46_13170 [Candidatus Zixiibacteriota bacterium]|nr:MAG: hypothetical protein DRP46_13170 [candidate division Zixibacteria bacterium]